MTITIVKIWASKPIKVLFFQYIATIANRIVPFVARDLMLAGLAVMNESECVWLHFYGNRHIQKQSYTLRGQLLGWGEYALKIYDANFVNITRPAMP